MTIEEMKKRKKEKGYTYTQMAELSGVPLGTIQKIFSGETSSPRYDTLQALEKIFEEEAVIRDAVPYSVHTQGSYTVDDYYTLPDDKRVELIDGYFYDMASPTSIHQKIALNMAVQISNFIEKNKGKCEPMMAPIDVMLDCDDDTMVQPDLIIVCDKDKIRRWGIYGAPDFVVEIISPSTRKKDYIIKMNKYMNAGVREYWILDPYKKVLMVYAFENKECPFIYRLGKPVPVGIYNGKLEISFDKILKEIEEFESLKD